MTQSTTPASTAVNQDIPAPRLDSQGNHLQLYGAPAQHDSPNSLRRLGITPGLQVASRREKARLGGRPQVALFCSDYPWSLDFRLTAEEARTLAVSLVNAAEACDTLDRRLSADSKLRKTTAV